MKQAVTTICTYTDPDYGQRIIMLIPDPRPRIDKNGQYLGISPLNSDGKLTQLLPVAVLKFIGGYTDKDESTLDASIRELGEEAGAWIAEHASKQPKIAYVMERKSSHSNGTLRLTYVHAHIGTHRTADVIQNIDPGDDCLALAIVNADALLQNNEGFYFAQNAVAEIKIQRQYTPIYYSEWYAYTSETSRRIFDHYNMHAVNDVAYGLNMADLKASEINVYCPKDAEKTASLPSSAFGTTGGSVSDGAICKMVIDHL